MYVDIREQCYECPQIKAEGEIQVGCQLGGGPEEAYSCKLNRNMSVACIHSCKCSVMHSCDSCVVDEWNSCPYL